MTVDQERTHSQRGNDFVVGGAVVSVVVVVVVVIVVVVVAVAVVSFVFCNIFVVASGCLS